MDRVWTGDWLVLDPPQATPSMGVTFWWRGAANYADVAPVKGIFHGGPTARLDVEVTLKRIG